MKELAQRFIGKDTYIKLLDGNADGIIKEVTDSGIVLENKGNLQVINLNYVIKIGSIIFFVGLPPRNVLICYATLDRMGKQCCSFITDGEELKNNLLFLRQAT